LLVVMVRALLALAQRRLLQAPPAEVETRIASAV
jgi:hypothetical protein